MTKSERKTTMIQHTPGPWEQGSEKVVAYGIHINGDGVWLATANGDHYRPGERLHEGFPGNNEAQANARLIAAAPELLEALNGLLAIIYESKGVDGYHLNGDIATWSEFEEVEIAEAVTDKVKGNQS